MITRPLQLRYGETAQRPAAAWLIPGDRPSHWLEELLSWGLPLKDVILYVVPRSAADPTALGALAVIPAGQPQVSRRCQGYGPIAGQGWNGSAGGLYLPVEARLDPEVTDAEVAALLDAADDVYVLHPSAGLIRFHAADARRVADLLQAPPRREAVWDRADPGIILSRRLLSIEPASTVSWDTVLDAGGEDIASRQPSLEDLPPARMNRPVPRWLGRAAPCSDIWRASCDGRLARHRNPAPGATSRAGSANGPSDNWPGSTRRSWPAAIGSSCDCCIYCKRTPTMDCDSPCRSNQRAGIVALRRPASGWHLATPTSVCGGYAGVDRLIRGNCQAISTRDCRPDTINWPAASWPWDVIGERRIFMRSCSATWPWLLRH